MNHFELYKRMSRKCYEHTRSVGTNYDELRSASSGQVTGAAHITMVTLFHWQTGSITKRLTIKKKQ